MTRRMDWCRAGHHGGCPGVILRLRDHTETDQLIRCGCTCHEDDSGCHRDS